MVILGNILGHDGVIRVGMTPRIRLQKGVTSRFDELWLFRFEESV